MRGLSSPRSDSDEEAEPAEPGPGPVVVRLVENDAEEYETDSGEEEDWWHPERAQGEKVQVNDKSGKIVILLPVPANSTCSTFTLYLHHAVPAP